MTKASSFGIVNVTEHLHGVQIGLVNVARNGLLPVFVIFNAALWWALLAPYGAGRGRAHSLLSGTQ